MSLFKSFRVWENADIREHFTLFVFTGKLGQPRYNTAMVAVRGTRYTATVAVRGSPQWARYAVGGGSKMCSKRVGTRAR